jgi:hypothetical protein
LFSHRAQAVLAEYTEIKKVMDTRSSYKVLRTMCRQADPPVVPYLGIYLGDLVFIEDGNLDEVDGGLINFKKRYGSIRILLRVLSITEKLRAGGGGNYQIISRNLHLPGDWSRTLCGSCSSSRGRRTAFTRCVLVFLPFVLAYK